MCCLYPSGQIFLEHHAPHQTGFGHKNEEKSRAFPSTTSDSSHTFESLHEASQPVGPNVPNKGKLLFAYLNYSFCINMMESQWKQSQGHWYRKPYPLNQMPLPKISRG